VLFLVQILFPVCLNSVEHSSEFGGQLC